MNTTNELLLVIILPLLFAIIFSFFYKKIQSKNSKLVDSKKISNCLDTVSLKLLLPTFVIHSILVTNVNFSMLIYVLLGIFFPLIVIITSKIIQSKIGIKKELILSIATHGGGNRGVLTILIIWGGVESFNTILTTFMFVDLGHTIYMLGILPFIIKRILKIKTKNSYKINLKKIIDSYPMIAVLWVSVILLILKSNTLSVDDLLDYLDNTKMVRKNIFSIFLLTSILLKIKLDYFSFSTISRILIHFFTIKILSLLIVFSLSLVLFPVEISLIAVIILAFMPPSSMLPAMLYQAKTPENIDEKVNMYIVVLNAVFLFVLIFIIILKLLFQQLF